MTRQLQRMILACVLAFQQPLLTAAESDDPRDEPSIFGLCSSAESRRDFKKWLPTMAEAGARWVRLWSGWHGIEKQQGVFDWSSTDEVVAQAKQHNMKCIGTLVFIPKWASTKNDYWQVPPKKMDYWSNYVSESVKRYKNDVKYWEIWNEFNAGFSKVSKGVSKPKVYADMVKAASIAAKAIDPDAKIGMSCANFDINFFDQAIKAGAGGHFDYLCVHPYENLGEVAKGGGEPGYLSLTSTLRQMLKSNGLNEDMPLWITEIGKTAPNKEDPVAEALQSQTLVKCFILSAAAGFDVVTWFEVRGPNYGHGKDHSLLRKDWTERPALAAWRQLTAEVGVRQSYQGWLQVGDKGYGFVFKHGAEYVLCAWAPTDDGLAITFPNEVTIAHVNGESKSIPANASFQMNRGVHYIRGIHKDLIALAQANKSKKFPWGGDYSDKKMVRHVLGSGVEEGVRPTTPDELTLMNELTSTYVKTVNSKGKVPGHVPFRVHHSFVTDMPRKIKITLVAKRADQKKRAKPFMWFYESQKGYRPPKDKTWDIPAGEDWQEHSWVVEDANFAGQWGYNFTFGTSNMPFLIKEVRVERLD